MATSSDDLCRILSSNSAAGYVQQLVWAQVIQVSVMRCTLCALYSVYCGRYIYICSIMQNTTRKMLECMYVFAWAFNRIYATEVVVLHCGAQ